MICENCYVSDEIDALGRYLIDKNLGKSFFEIVEKYMHSNNEYASCENCGNKLNIGEWIFEDEDFLYYDLGKLTAATLLDKISKFDGSREDELIGSINANFSERGEDTEKELKDIGGPEELDDVIQNIFSFINSELLNKIKSGMFDYLHDNLFYEPVDETTNGLTKEAENYTNKFFFGDDDVEKEQSNMLDQAVTFICKLSEKDLNLFKDRIENEKFLDKNEIFGNLKKVFKNQSRIAVLIKKNKFYRARTLDKKEIEDLKYLNNKKDIEKLKRIALTPPIGVPSQGRWNQGGKPTTLYVSNKYRGLQEELKKDRNKSLVIFTLETNKSRSLMPIPFSSRFRSSEFYKRISEPVDKKKDELIYNQQYVLSNLLGKVILNSGYDGIIYDPMSNNSSCDYNSNSMNFAIFNHYVKYLKNSKETSDLWDFKDITVKNYFVYQN